MVKGLENIDLVEIVNRAGVITRQVGSKHAGLCPFHKEANPSFFVFSNNRFKCFGCGEHGDAIDFIRKTTGYSFSECLKALGLSDPNGPKRPGFPAGWDKKVELIKRFRKWEAQAANELGALIRSTYRAMSKWVSVEDMENAGEILHSLAIWEHYLFDILVGGNERDKFKLFKWWIANGRSF
ncbi:MAG: hypothetical protein JRJ54_15760, partial [Deltaproteobacteria bacterium]|nr:hypothetical protein [Deltaproteobacteria bacterium]